MASIRAWGIKCWYLRIVRCRYLRILFPIQVDIRDVSAASHFCHSGNKLHWIQPLTVLNCEVNDLGGVANCVTQCSLASLTSRVGGFYIMLKCWPVKDLEVGKKYKSWEQRMQCWAHFFAWDCRQVAARCCWCPAEGLMNKLFSGTDRNDLWHKIKRISYYSTLEGVSL